MPPDPSHPHDAQHESLFLPLPDTWRRFGLFTTFGRPRAVPLSGGRLAQLGGPPWILLFDWAADQIAWEALLTTQETIQPERLSLPPWLTVLMLFLCRMAEQPHGVGVPGGDRPGRWLELLPAVLESTACLTDALYTLWLNGTSAAATGYRSRIPRQKSLDRNGQEALNAIERFFGADWLDALAAAERPEPIVLRLLDTAGTQLWTAGSPAVLAARPKPPSTLQALLPVGRWHPATTLTELSVPRSMSDCLRQWQTWARAAGQEQAP